MNYSALIEHRKSVREFTDRSVSIGEVHQIDMYYQDSAKRLIPGLETQLSIFGTEVREKLEGAAGYQEFLIGAPRYLVLLSAPGDFAGENAGYIMEDLVLKLTDLGLDSCWLTFTDKDAVKEALGITSDLEVAAIVAFGYGVKGKRRLRINVKSMSNVDIKAQRQYFAPKLNLYDMVYLNTWGNREGVEERLGFYEDMLWASLYAASLSPSYLNRQAYSFVLHDGRITLVQEPDEYASDWDSRLDHGVVLLHFSSVASQWSGDLRWELGEGSASLQLPEGCKVVASCKL